jgi:hypothetical protein
VWYAKYRLPDGRQVQKKIGPAWTSRGRPADGYFTKRTAEAWLRDVLDQARRGTPPGLVRTRVKFAEVADEWLRYVEHDRDCKPATLSDYSTWTARRCAVDSSPRKSEPACGPSASTICATRSLRSQSAAPSR